MVSVSKRRIGSGVAWVVRWRDPAGVQHKRQYRRKLDADRYRQSIEAGLTDGSYVDPGRSKVTVGAWAAEWIERQGHVKPKTINDYRSLLRTRILPRWESVLLSRVTHADVAAWVAGMGREGLSASRQRQAYHLLRGMLADAVKDNRLPRNPAEDVDLPRLPTTERTYLDHDQVAKLADACGPYRVLVLVLAYCGLRWGEATALRVRHVDLNRRRLAVVEAVSDVGGVMVFGSPKTHQQRSVPVPRFVLDELAEHIADRGPDDLAFTAPRGGVLRVQNFRRRVWDPACDAIGMRGVTPHELRHTAASLAIGAGASVKGVQAMLGHASATLTLDRYGHLMGSELDAVADRLEAARGAGAPSERPSALPGDLDELVATP